MAIDSYVISGEPFDFAEEFLTAAAADSDFPRATELSVIHSPRLLGIGKSIVGIAAASLRNLEKVNCPDEDSSSKNKEQQCNKHQQPNVTLDAEVYEALRILAKSHSINYSVMTRMAKHGELIGIAGYQLQPMQLTITPRQSNRDRVKDLCVKEMRGNCRGCLNFHQGHAGLLPPLF